MISCGWPSGSDSQIITMLVILLALDSNLKYVSGDLIKELVGVVVRKQLKPR